MASTSSDAATPMSELERRGGMALLAHVAAGALLLAFSAGSLVSISAVAFYRFLAQWNAGVFDLPDAISLIVNVLLVVSADVGMLYAASVLRNLSASGAPVSEQRVHKWAMLGACVLESSTYLYLVWSFDRPTTLFLWSIGIARALAAPLFAAYLSLAKPLPVHARDVAYHASLHSGRGVVRDVAALAADPDAPLAHKVRVFTAASVMAPQDRARFDEIIQAVSERDPEDSRALPEREDFPTPRPPTGPGSPVQARKTPARRARTPEPHVLELPSSTQRRAAARARSRGSNPNRVRTRSVEAKVRAVWTTDMTVGQLQRAAGISRSTAARWRSTLAAEQAAL